MNVRHMLNQINRALKPGAASDPGNGKDSSPYAVIEDIGGLLASPKELRAFLNAMTDVGLVVSADGRYLKIAPTSPQLLYRPADELLGKTFRKVFPPAQAEEFLRVIQLALASSRLQHIEYSLPISGEERWFLATISPMGDDKVIWLARDITDRKLAEDALRRSEERWRAYFEQANELIFILDEGGNIETVNDAVCETLGYRPAELIGRDAIELVDEDLRQSVLEHLWKDAHAREGQLYEVGVRTRDGRKVSLEIRGRILYENKRRAGNFYIARDVTERKRREREREALLAMDRALRSAPTPSVVLPELLKRIETLLVADGCVLALREILGGEVSVVEACGYGAQMKGKRLSPEDSMTARLMAKGEPISITDAWKDGISPMPGLDPSIAAFIGAPLIVQQEKIGMLWVGRKRPFEHEDLDALESIADLIADALHRDRLFEQAQRRIKRLTALRNIDMAITSSLDVQITLNILLDQVRTQLGVDAADVLLINPGTHLLRCAAFSGFHTSGITHTHLKLGEGHAGRAVLTRSTFHVDNVPDDRGALARAPYLISEGFKVYYGVPLIAKGEVKGVLEIFHRSSLVTDSEWLSYLEDMATLAAIALENATLFNDLQRSNLELNLAYDATLEGWVNALDLRDNETEVHTQRVTTMTLRLARLMGVDEAELAHYRRGALLHDIGKMGIPDEILHKPGPLTEEEFKVMRQHPEHALRLLSPIPYLRPALDIPYCHHEKWDGSGYPRGLKGELIPLSARIFAVVDVWDALLADRPYRKALPRGKALEYIRSQAGKHFDPRVVAAFLNLLEEDEG